MSLFEHLVERALGLGRPVEPVIDPSRLGPPTIGPSTTPGFEETIVEVPAGGPSAAQTTSVVVRPPSSPTSSSVRESTPTLAPASVIVPRSDPRPLVESPRITSTSASGPTVGEPGGSSVIVERRVEQRVELAREREPSVEPKSQSAPLLERVVRVRSASPVEPKFESRVEAPRSEPSVIEPRPTLAAPILPVPTPGHETPRLATSAAPTRRGERSGSGQANSVPIASRLAPEPGPTLRIEIGRVIVRAESPAPQRREAGASARPMTSLADYLTRRDRGER